VIELCSGGDLEGVIEHHKEAGTIMDTAAIKSFILQTTQGLEYLHDMWIIHRDMKPGNIFITDRGVCKIGDFGMVRLSFRQHLRNACSP
jgi:cyclin-dependent kinase 7